MRIRQAMRYAAVLLLPAFPPGSATSTARARTDGYGGAGVPDGIESPPYLPALKGAMALRFQAAPPVPMPEPKPTPATTPAAATPEPAPAARPAVAAETTTEPARKDPASPRTSSTYGRLESGLVADDARAAVRPEDFLPYFQIPGSSRNPNDVILVPGAPSAPVPGAIPPSSATYTQTPK